MHNAYAHIYNKLVFEVLEERFGKDEACVFARTATAGGQRYVLNMFFERRCSDFVLKGSLWYVFGMFCSCDYAYYRDGSTGVVTVRARGRPWPKPCVGD
jgi:hypothetical protein